MKLVTVYRLEMFGHGPFNVLGRAQSVLQKKEHADDILISSMEMSLPDWRRDFTLSMEIERTIPNCMPKDDPFRAKSYVNMRHWTSGCVSKSTLRQWVVKRFTLENLGFKVAEYQVPEDAVLVGDFQAIFIRKKAKKIRTHKISEFFKR